MSEIRSQLTLDLAQQQAQLRALDSQMQARDRRVEGLRGRIQQMQAKARQVESQVAGLGRRIAKGAFRTAVTVAGSEIEQELGLSASFAGRLGMDAVQGLAIGGPKAAIATVALGLLREAVGVLKEAKRQNEEGRKRLEAIEARRAREREQEREREIRRQQEFDKDVIRLREEAAKSAADDYYKLAVLIGRRAG